MSAGPDAAPPSSGWGRRVLGQVGGLAALAGLAGLEFHRVFGWAALAPRVVGAAVLAAGVPLVLLRTRRRDVWVTVPASLILLAGYLVLVTQLVVPVTSPGGLVDGLVNGWSRLLTISVPSPARGDLLVLPVLLTWWAAMVGVEVALRTRGNLAAVIPSGVAYVVALLFTVGTPGSRLPAVVAWVAVTVVVVRLGDRPVVDAAEPVTRAQGRTARRRIALPTLGVLVAVVVAAGLIGPRLPGSGSDSPYDPRASRVPPTDELTTVNPLSLVSQWARSPDTPVFTVRAATPAAWTLAVLDRYDGAGWSADTRFSASGERLPRDPGRSGTTVDPLVQQIRIQELGGVWLPAAAQPVSVRGVGAYVDPGSGTLAVRSGLEPGLTYEVVSERLRSDDCTTASVSASADLEIPTSDTNAAFQQSIATLAQRITSGITSPCGRARAIERYLIDNFRFDAKAPAGSHLRILSDFLTVPERGRGTSEQFAAAFALLGRYVGLPTRVVVGFHAGTEAGDGRWAVETGDGFAWAEVRFDGLGWVAFDPTPLSDAAPRPPEKIAEEEAKADAPKDPDAPGAPPVVEQVTDAQRDAATGRSLLAQVLQGVGVVLAVVVVIAAVVGTVAAAGRRRRRRRRRSASGLRRQVVGAWWEALDALEDGGLDADRGRTAAQWVGAGEARFGADGVGDLAALAVMVNEALFGPVEPTPTVVTRAWEIADGVTRTTTGRMTRGARLRRRMDLRPWRAPVPPDLDAGPVAPDRVVSRAATGA